MNEQHHNERAYRYYILAPVVIGLVGQLVSADIHVSSNQPSNTNVQAMLFELIFSKIRCLWRGIRQISSLGCRSMDMEHTETRRHQDSARLRTTPW